MSTIFDEWKKQRHLHGHCELSRFLCSSCLLAIRKDQVEQINNIGVAAAAIGIEERTDKEAAKNGKREIVVHENQVDGPTQLLQFVTFVHLPFSFWSLNVLFHRG